jgi:ADP-ribosylglycohydrolase
MTGNWWWAPGEWTDDTAIALLRAESIAERGLLDEHDPAGRYIEWATNDGKGIGLATSPARLGAKDADQARALASAHHEAARLAASNGTVMGVTTIGLATDDLERAEGTARQARLSRTAIRSPATTRPRCARR